MWIIFKKLILLWSSHETTPMSTRVMTTRSLKFFLELQSGRKNKNSAIHHFHIDHNANCSPLSPPRPPKKMHNHCLIVFDFSRGDCNTQEKLQTMIMQNWEGGGGGGGGGEGVSLGNWYSQYEVPFGWLNLWKNCAKIMVKRILLGRCTVNIFVQN